MCKEKSQFVTVKHSKESTALNSHLKSLVDERALNGSLGMRWGFFG
jgi:hypothetical protein